MISETDPYFPSHSKSKIIYSSCLLFCLVLSAALPFSEFEVSLSSPAVVRPSSEVTTIRCISSGRLNMVNLFENKKIRKGDVLYILESASLIEQEKYNLEKISFKNSLIHDVRLVMTAGSGNESESETAFKTSFYRQRYFAYQQKLMEAQTGYRKAWQDFDRNNKLFTEKVIARVEFENSQFELQKADDAIRQIKESQFSQWQSELRDLLEEKMESESQLRRLQKEKSELTVRAAVSGTVQNTTGVYAGSVVYANQELAQISPDTSLLVIAYLQPNNIGLVKKNMAVRLQVDAFLHNQWGLASGTVMIVSQDIKIVDSKPVFEVRCSLDKNFLELKNGARGFLTKGMTMKAHFIVTQRSLWQLLYDKMDDWLNPNLP